MKLAKASLFFSLLIPKLGIKRYVSHSTNIKVIQ